MALGNGRKLYRVSLIAWIIVHLNYISVSLYVNLVPLFLSLGPLFGSCTLPIIGNHRQIISLCCGALSTLHIWSHIQQWQRVYARVTEGKFSQLNSVCNCWWECCNYSNWRSFNGQNTTINISGGNGFSVELGSIETISQVRSIKYWWD